LAAHALSCSMVFARLRLAARNSQSLRQPAGAGEEEPVLARSPRIRIALALLAFVTSSSAAAEEKKDGGESQLLLATTTSVQDTGLLDALLPVFRERTGIA